MNLCTHTNTPTPNMVLVGFFFLFPSVMLLFYCFLRNCDHFLIIVPFIKRLKASSPSLSKLGMPQLSWCSTRMGIQWGPLGPEDVIHLGLHAFIILQLVVFSQIVEQLSCDTLRHRRESNGLFALYLFLLNTTFPESKTLPNNSWFWAVSSLPSAQEIRFSFC